MNHVEICFDLTVHSAFFIGSGLGIAGIVDKACMKDAEGFIYIPGSSIKGKIRYYCKQLLQLPKFKTSVEICETFNNPEVCKSDNPCLICRLFGSNYTEGALHFHNAQLKDEFRSVLDKKNPIDMKYQTNLRTNNKINRYTRTTEKGHLFTTEAGEKGFVFDGTIIGCFDVVICEESEYKTPLELFLLMSGLHLVNNIGGQKSRGMGNCKVEISKIMIDGIQYNPSNILHDNIFLEWELAVMEGKL